MVRARRVALLLFGWKPNVLLLTLGQYISNANDHNRHKRTLQFLSSGHIHHMFAFLDNSVGVEPTYLCFAGKRLTVQPAAVIEYGATGRI